MKVVYKYRHRDKEKLQKISMNKDSHTERPHALLGGSSADRWSNCPGSIFLKKQLPERKVREEALLGTRAHEALEILLQAFLTYKIEGTPWPIQVDVEPEILDVAHQTITDLWEKVLFESITDKTYGLETKFILSSRLEMYGYVDFWCVYIDNKGKKAGVVFDFKHGFHAVKVERNAQLAFYACALQESLRRKGRELDYVRGVIYQPRVWGEDPYKETKFTAKQLDDWKGKFFKAGNLIIVEKREKFKVGPWCEFCDGQSICPTYRSDLSRNTSLKLLDNEVLHEKIEFPRPEMISDEDLVRIITYGEKVKKFIDSCKSYAIDRNLNGMPIKGTKLVETKTRRKWKENEEEIAEELYKLGAHNVAKIKLLGILAVETELSQVYGKKEAKRLLDNFTTMTVPSIQLVPDGDIREGLPNSQTLLTYEEIHYETKNDEKITG